MINQPYDEAFISVFYFQDESYFMEHNDPLTIEESEKIIDFVVSELKKKGDQEV